MGIRDVNSLTGMILNKLNSSATQSTNSASTAVQDFKKIVAEGGFMSFAGVDTGDDVTAQPIEKEVKVADSSSKDKKTERPTSEKTDKKGGKYLVFSAFSTEKDGDAFAFTWVRFIRFSAEREAFLVPKTGITAKGKLELSAYLDKLNIACRVEELAEWVKKEHNNQTQA